MKIRLLGPVELECARRALDVGPRQRRAVLAALAVDAGTPVSSDDLVDRVWGPSAPCASRSSLYAHVTRLRRTLAEAGDDGEAPVSLLRHDGGYVLNIDRRSVDHHRFQELVEASRAAPESSEERITLLREAMGLWRGTPLAALSTSWALRVRRGVEHQFTGLAAAWGAEELRRGNAESVADRLAGLVGAYPLAEPLVAIQMRALCAAGRASEALQYYAETRAQIVEQLGAEPGPELRRTHLAALRGELDRRSPFDAPDRRAGPVRDIPRQLPADLSRFVGRSRQLERVLGAFTSSVDRGSTLVVSINGAPGVGKSTLAIHAAHHLVDRYPDGQIYLALRGSGSSASPLHPADALAQLLRAVGVAAPYKPVEVDEAAALFRSVVAGRRLLLVLDNAADTAQVRPLLPSGTRCGTLITSVQPLAGLGDVGQVRLGPLSLAESLTLLGQWVGTARIAAEPAAAAAIVRWCEGLPLALRIAGARLVGRPNWPLAELRDRLADERRRLDNLELDGIGLRASIGVSYQRLSRSPDLAERATAEAFKLLGALDEPELDRSAAARVLTRSEADAERMLERLVDAQLLETSSPGIYRMGELVRLYARERLAGRQEEAMTQ